MEPIGVHCHELGHVLGLPDKYGVGPRGRLWIYCLMAEAEAAAATTAGSRSRRRPLTPLEAARREGRRRIDEGFDALLKLLDGQASAPRRLSKPRGARRGA